MLGNVQFFVVPWPIVCQAPLPMEFSRQEYWSGLSFRSPGDLPDPGMELTSLLFSALAGGFFATSAIWEALTFKYKLLKGSGEINWSH